jgi:hypothetical protein
MKKSMDGRTVPNGAWERAFTLHGFDFPNEADCRTRPWGERHSICTRCRFECIFGVTIKKTTYCKHYNHKRFHLYEQAPDLLTGAVVETAALGSGCAAAGSRLA